MVWLADMVGWLDGYTTSKSRLLILLTLALCRTNNATQLVTRIEIRIMRLRKDKGVGIKGVLQATQDPNVPKIIPLLYLV